MKAERVSLFIAIFCGIVVGAFTAQSIADAFTFGKYFWFLGAALGGAVAWIGVDVHRFAKGTKLAVQHAWNQVIAWRPDKTFWRMMLHACIALSVFCFYFYLFFAVIAPDNEKYVLLPTSAVLSIISYYMLIVNEVWISRDSVTQRSRQMWQNANPFTVLFRVFTVVIPIGVRIAIEVMRNAPNTFVTTLRFLRRAAKLMFLYTNHERRTAGFVFAAIGASVGYFYGHALIIAFVGAVFGVLEFEFAKKFRDRLADDRQTT